MTGGGKTVLWWGRFDPDYSRNRVLRQAYAALGWEIVDFHPRFSLLADIEARLRPPARADLVHVPCFRQRDIAAARRYVQRRDIPLLIDPLISAYDKQVFERGKFAPASVRARRLLQRERDLFQGADIVLADTSEHLHFFADTLGVDRGRAHVVYVGAEESMFRPQAPRPPHDPVEVLFYGSFIALQGPEVIVAAARRYTGPAIRWVLLGDGPLRAACQQAAQGLAQIAFEDWLPYPQLPARIHEADILLGVFGTSPKTQRVIPNKVFQALACGKPLVTCAAPAYPEVVRSATDGGIAWVPAGDAGALAEAVAALARSPQQLVTQGARARATYERNFSAAVMRAQLQAALATVA